MKMSLSVQWNGKGYVIMDISPAVLRLLNITGKTEDVIGADLVLPLCIKYLDLIRKSPIHYMEVLYPIGEISYTVKIVEDNKNYTLFFESLFCPVSSIQETDIDNSFFDDVNNILSNDKTITEIFALRNASKENINLEILYTVKKMQEDVTEIKQDYKHSFDKIDKEIDLIKATYIKEEVLTFYYVLEKIGIKKFIVFLFIVTLLETIVFQPLINPIYHQFVDSIFNVADD